MEGFIEGGQDIYKESCEMIFHRDSFCQSYKKLKHKKMKNMRDLVKALARPFPKLKYKR